MDVDSTFSWTDTARAVVASCLPCLPSSRHPAAPSGDNDNAGGVAAHRDELEGLLQSGEFTDTDAEADALSLHSHIGRSRDRDRARARRKKRKRLTLFGLDLFGRPLPDDQHDEDDGERERIARISSSTLDSDAAPLADEAIAQLSSPQAQAPAPDNARREHRRARRNTRLLDTHHDAFEGFPGSGAGAFPQAASDDFGAFQEARPAPPTQDYVHVPSGGADDADLDADFDAGAYVRTAAQRSSDSGGSGTRSRSHTSASVSLAHPHPLPPSTATTTSPPFTPSAPAPAPAPTPSTKSKPRSNSKSHAPKSHSKPKSKSGHRSATTTLSTSTSTSTSTTSHSQPHSPPAASPAPHVHIASASPDHTGHDSFAAFAGDTPRKPKHRPSPAQQELPSAAPAPARPARPRATTTTTTSTGSSGFPSAGLARPRSTTSSGFPSTGFGGGRGGRKNSGAFLARTGDDE